MENGINPNGGFTPNGMPNPNSANVKKGVVKGIWMGIALILLHKLLWMANIMQHMWQMYLVIAIFAVFVFAFLKTDSLPKLFACGGIALGVLIFSEVIILCILGTVGLTYSYFDSIAIYIAGFAGSIIGIVAAIALTAFDVRLDILPKINIKEGTMENKNKFLAYLLITFVSFTYLVMPQNAGVGVPIFAAIQAAMLPFIVKNKKALLWFVPAFIICLNSFISANNMWRVSNLFAFVILYALMFSGVNFADATRVFAKRMAKNIAAPFLYFVLPFKTMFAMKENRGKVVTRVLIGLAIAIPSVAILTALMCAADSIFRENVVKLFENLYKLININTIIKVILGGACALYLFGMVYNGCKQEKEIEAKPAKTRNGDLIIINILLISVVAIYTMFAIVQFRYLFARGQLPGDLEYFEYARRGFFELLALTAINIVIILVAVKFVIVKYQELWGKIAKYLSFYLCLLTVVMLASSFYRMWLYSADDGLTRLRLLVFCFLAFEFVGLLATFVYIIKPKFNIVLTYFVVMVVYYTFVNVLPIDYFVAKSQVDRYFFASDPGGIAYTLTLSADALPQVKRLVKTGIAHEEALSYIEDLEMQEAKTYPRWQRWNLALDQLGEAANDN